MPSYSRLPLRVAASFFTALLAGVVLVTGCSPAPGVSLTEGERASGIVQVTDATFASEVVGSKLPVLVDFWAPWCGPCRALGPTVEEVARENIGKLKVCKVNVDESPNSAQAYQVASIPFLAVFRGGKLVKSSVGLQPKSAILQLLEAN